MNTGLSCNVCALFHPSVLSLGSFLATCAFSHLFAKLEIPVQNIALRNILWIRGTFLGQLGSAKQQHLHSWFVSSMQTIHEISSEISPISLIYQGTEFSTSYFHAKQSLTSYFCTWHPCKCSSHLFSHTLRIIKMRNSLSTNRM